MSSLTTRSLFVLGLSLGAAPIFAAVQLLSEPLKRDSVAAVVADAEGLTLVAREELPWFGTFWVVRNSAPTIIAPLPCPPLNQSYPVYAISSRQFLVDETDAPLVLLSNRKATLTSADYAAIIEKQVDDLLNHVAWIQEAELMGVKEGAKAGRSAKWRPRFICSARTCAFIRQS